MPSMIVAILRAASNVPWSLASSAALLTITARAAHFDETRSDAGQNGEGSRDIGERGEIHFLKVKANVQRPMTDTSALPFFFIECWTLNVGRWTFSSFHRSRFYPVRFMSTVTSSPLPLDPPITSGLIAKHGLTPDEFERIKKILGRAPNFTELGIFSVMWSEHCSYKNSKRELRKFPTTGPTVLVKAGEENAGVIDIGDGWGIAFKMESHNHPSAIEPFQGAATGVGGILRDIFTMGARPVFLMDSLRFGDIRPASRTP